MSRGLFLLLLFSVISPLRAAEVMAVLSSDAPHYKEAYQDFQQAYGSTVPVVLLDRGLPEWAKDMKVAVTFGAKAATASFPDGVARVICMAPVLPREPSGPFTQVHLQAAPAAVAARIEEVSPTLKRLTVFWVSPSFDGYIADLERRLKPLGAAVERRKLESGDGLSAALGAMNSPPEAIWIPPDPALITNLNVSVLLQYASFNRALFFAPGAQFVEMGAAAAAVPPREELARLGAAAAKGFLSGQVPAGALFPAQADLFLNKASLDQSQRPMTPELKKKAKTVY